MELEQPIQLTWQKPPVPVQEPYLPEVAIVDHGENSDSIESLSVPDEEKNQYV